uniref:Uncharacterized protein n=1 Tax=Ditylenchus dipsaci TaxID=166011 RepID=A0A915DPT8_9BILA
MLDVSELQSCRIAGQHIQNWSWSQEETDPTTPLLALSPAAATSKPVTSSSKEEVVDQSAAPTSTTKRARTSVREMQQVNNAKPKVAAVVGDTLQPAAPPVNNEKCQKESNTNKTATPAPAHNKSTKVAMSEPKVTKKANVGAATATPLANVHKTPGAGKTREPVARVPLKARQPPLKAEKPEKEQISDVARVTEELEMKHKAELVEVQQKFNEELGVLKTSHEREIQQQKDEFTAEQQSFAEKLDKINAERQAKEHQIVELQHRIAEVEQVNGKLMAEKNMLEERLLKEDQDERNRRLIDEVNSLKYDLECKSQKLADLRKKNQELQYSVNTIPEKDTENQKLNHRVSDLKLELNQQRELQKVLSQQLEEARRDIKNGKLAYDQLLKDNEMMHYRMEGNGASSPESVLYTSANQSMMSSPSAVNLRQTGDRPSSGSSRPNSTSYSRSTVTPPRSENGMTKSWDISSNAGDTTLLSLYKEHGHKRILNTPTKIYAPDGTFEAGDSPIGSNLPVLSESSAQREIDLNILEEDSSPNESTEKTMLVSD